MRITNLLSSSLSQNDLTMVDENSASDPYIEENFIDHVENGHNVGSNSSNTTIEDSNNINATHNNNNSDTTTTKPLIQLNLFGEVSVDQGEKKWVKGYTKKDGTIVKGHMKFKNNMKASKKKTKKVKKSKPTNKANNALMTSFFKKIRSLNVTILVINFTLTSSFYIFHLFFHICATSTLL